MTIIHCNISAIYEIVFIVKEIWFLLEKIKEKTHGNQKNIDTYQQNHVYFVNIACKFIMVTLTRVASK